jgi:5-methylcytosine-specific restriction endonuclease McrA
MLLEQHSSPNQMIEEGSPMADGKICTFCKVLKPYSDYNKMRASKDGHQARCRDCQRDTHANWRLKNHERWSAYKAKWRSENADIQKAATLRWRENNAKHYAEWRRQYNRSPAGKAALQKYRDNNKDVISARQKLARDNDHWRQSHALRQRARRAHVQIPKKEYLAWLNAQDKRCFYCEIDCEESFHVDHWKPLAAGGPHALHNLVIACPPCNLSKGAKDPIEFMQKVKKRC